MIGRTVSRTTASPNGSAAVASIFNSVGLVLYEMVTGQPAVSGRNSALVFDAILHQTPAAPVRLNPQVPLDLERIITRAIDKDRSVPVTAQSSHKPGESFAWRSAASRRRDTPSGESRLFEDSMRGGVLDGLI